MKRVLILTFVLAMATALAAPVAAKPPTDPRRPPGSTHPDGLTCMESAEDFDHPPMEWHPGAGPLVVRLSSKERVVCIDVYSDIAADYRVEIIEQANLRDASSWVRDSHPGDFCEHGARGDLNDGGKIMYGIPASTVDACGTEYTDASEALAFAVSAAFSRGPEGWVDVRLTRIDP